ISNVSGRLAEPRELMQADYWRRHVRAPVRFAEGVTTLLQLSPDVCIEVGPNATLLAFLQTCLEASPGAAVPTLVATLRKGRADAEQLVDALATLYLCGASLNWREILLETSSLPIELPTYP